MEEEEDDDDDDDDDEEEEEDDDDDEDDDDEVRSLFDAFQSRALFFLTSLLIREIVRS